MAVFSGPLFQIYVYIINKPILFDCHRRRYRTDGDEHQRDFDYRAVHGGERFVDAYPSSTANVMGNDRRHFCTQRMIAVSLELNAPPPR